STSTLLSVPLIYVWKLLSLWVLIFFFFFQAEDGIRDFHVTGVQTCALPISVLCLARGLREPEHRSFLVDRTVSKGPGAARGEARADRLRIALRPGGALAGVCQRAGHPSRRRLPEDCPRAYRGRPPVEDDEAGDRHLRYLQADVRQVQPGGGQGAVPDPVLHRGPPGDHRRGHDEPDPVAQAQRFPC